MKEFKDLEFKDLPDGSGIYSRTMFENGFGASVICHKYSYGGKDGLYELAVLDTGGYLHYDNSVANGDVCGYLTEDDVTKLLKEIQLL
jgi:hypothetical protein